MVIENSGKCLLDEQPATWNFCMDYTNGHNQPNKLGIVISIDGEAVCYGQLIGEDMFKLLGGTLGIWIEYSKAGN